ncbi:serine/threonine-protein kinase [Dactylosporangium sp. NPDC051485]|uniref:serine/threonine-protein kinase n=1 Tax=Dactylosporangium sp. NPDC051485 TaxID=3154846 RepID=UPI00341A1918
MSQSIPTDEWVFANRYRVDAPIGRGGMGEVWSGYDQQLDRRVAIKLMHQVPGQTLQPGSPEGQVLADAAAVDRERFLREIRTTARLELPGIPSVYDFGVDESTGRIYLVMQLLFGQTLAELIKVRDYADDPWPISWAAAIAAQVAATLVDVHRVDVVHRDIKPSNLIVTGDGLVKVLDFGVAVLHGASALPRLTQIGMTVGSPPYMPPEQVLGNPVGPSSDVYALGCVLHEMLTGRVPFVETTSRSHRDHHVNTPAASMRTVRGDVPSALDELVLAMLAKQPGDRPDADTVYDGLLPIARSEGPDAIGERDPRRPFVRPLAPARRPRSATPAGARAAAPSSELLTAEEALDVLDRVAQLLQDQQLQHAIDLLDRAAARPVDDPDVARQIQIDLGTTLHIADEHSRAAAVLDAVLPTFDGEDGDMALLYYYAGVSHAEIGETGSAVEYLTRFLAIIGADQDDQLYRDALYQLGMLLAADGRTEDGLRYLNQLRPILAAEYGPQSVHVTTLDRRIAQIRLRSAKG